jgi:hypothetical protein
MDWLSVARRFRLVIANGSPVLTLQFASLPRVGSLENVTEVLGGYGLASEGVVKAANCHISGLRKSPWQKHTAKMAGTSRL